MIARPVLHNRYLPNWLHRACNAGFASMLIATLGTLAVTNLLPNALQAVGLGIVVTTTVAMGLVLLIVDPNRFSTVESCAGGLGYDELTDEEVEGPTKEIGID